MKAHQIFLTNNKKIPEKGPDLLIECCESFRTAYSELDYHLYSGEEIEDMIKNNFDKDVFLAYQKLIPLTFKCDLARMCLLYLYGGMYSDLFYLHVLKINLNSIKDYDFCVFRDRQHVREDTWLSWAVATSILYAKQKSIIAEKHIKNIIENCRNEYYGENALDICGPLALGKSIYKAFFDSEDKNNFFKNNVKILGEQKDLTLGYANENMAFVTDYGEIIAFKKKANQGIFYNLNGNDYNIFYDNKNVYNKDIKI